MLMVVARRIVPLVGFATECSALVAPAVVAGLAWAALVLASRMLRTRHQSLLGGLGRLRFGQARASQWKADDAEVKMATRRRKKERV